MKKFLAVALVISGLSCLIVLGKQSRSVGAIALLPLNSSNRLPDLEEIIEGYRVTIAGRIVRPSCDPGAIANARVILDDRHQTVTDTQGYFRFPEVELSRVIGLPPGNHVLVAADRDHRTKIVRITKEFLMQRLEVSEQSASPCLNLDFTMNRISSPSCGNPPTNTIDANDTRAGDVIDVDQDGVDDLIEDWLAERFAPIVYHGERETNLPVSVDWLLARTGLYEYDADAGASKQVTGPIVSQMALLDRGFAKGKGRIVYSSGTRSRCKRSTYFLADLGSREGRSGSPSPGDWVTYVHSFGNNRGGVTLQFWRCYAYNDSRFLFFDMGHGGDWEGIAVHLNSVLRPETVSFLGHRGIERRRYEEVRWEGDHPKVWSEEGGHASRHDPPRSKSSRFTRQETWTGGRVASWDGKLRGTGGGLLNVGEKLSPRNGQVFIQYSGLWGTPRSWFLTSGYWGPAFNDTEARCQDSSNAYPIGLTCGANRSDCGRIFHAAWCEGMDGTLLDVDLECYASSTSP